MQTTGNTILITGGATGIGFALAEAFVAAGNEVIICGRREERLREARERVPQLHTRCCDLAGEAGREALYDWVIAEFPRVNVLVNNAGLQRAIDLTAGIAPLRCTDDEIEINLRAPIHLAAYFIPHFRALPEAAIVNVSSGLGFVPLAFMPIYCATKAALHSFTISLRHQLRDTSIRVFEIIPPTVDTELDQGRRTAAGRERGIPPAEVAAATLEALARDEFELAVGMAARLRQGSRENPEGAFLGMNR
jgi:uncharacterized oxidoreductase